MSIQIKALTCLLVCCICASLICLPTRAAEKAAAAPAVSAQSAVLMEAESGEIVFAHNADLPLAMASTTKIMTALVALELASPDRVIEVDPEAVGVEGSSIYLSAGEPLTLEELLYALLLESANDAAAAIAIGLSGSVEAFADEMNRKARSLGLVATHFTNPHGLDDAEHYTTARELAIISRAALQNELIRTISSTRKTTIPHAGTDGVRLLVNHNKMLRLYEGCIGLKTGFTKKSGRSLVSAAERDGVRLIAVTLNAPDDWNDHTKMLDYGFTLFRGETLCQEGELLHPLPLVGGQDAYVMLGNREAYTVTLPIGAGEIHAVIECRPFEFAGVEEGTLLGCVRYLSDLDGDGKEETVATVPLYTLYTVERTAEPRGFWSRLWAWIFGD